MKILITGANSYLVPHLNVIFVKIIQMIVIETLDMIANWKNYDFSNYDSVFMWLE